MSNNNLIQLVECPRDAIQGIKHGIPTARKIAYINQLIDSNLFAYIDFGSFVSPKAVPQMQDTAEVLEGLIKNKETKLLAIIANEKGAERAVQLDKIDFLGYPFSISETFQQRNANSSIAESYRRVANITDIMGVGKQELVVYISMAFGNPYGDVWSEGLVNYWIAKLLELGVKRFSIADTTGEASVAQIKSLFAKLVDEFPKVDLGIHLHSRAETALPKINAAFEAGCRRFEGAMLGYGGCPFAQDDLVGNIPMEVLLQRFSQGTTSEIARLTAGFNYLVQEDGL